MAKKEPVDLGRRISHVDAERGEESVETFVRLQDVDEFDPVESNMTAEYLKEITIDDVTSAPFMFTKGMPLEENEDGDRYSQGIVSKERKMENYRNPVRFRSALTGSGKKFERGGERAFIGVPNTYTIGLQGMETWRGIMPGAPRPMGVENAAEMIDLYAMEQLRDVPFTAWPNEPGGGGPQTVSEITAADSDVPKPLRETLRQLETDLQTASDRAEDEEEYDGPWYSVDRLFINDDIDSVDSWGPYVSQFLLHEVNLWALPADQRYLRYERGKDYNNTEAEWLDTLEGKDQNAAEYNPNTPSGDNPRGYIATPRHLATIVNAEPPYQEYLIAALRLIGTVEFDRRLEYVVPDTDGDGETEIDVFDYVDGGPIGLFELLARVSRHALLAAFFQKYYVHFRCRPETYAGRVRAQQQDSQTDLEIDELLIESEILRNRTGEENLLSSAYEEGSPVHPAYPSGHSVIAGACGTVLKTWFEDEDWPEGLPYYVPTHDDDTFGTFGTGLKDLKSDADCAGVPAGHNGVAQEIDKLMANVGIGRMFAGVHYYSDHYEGVKLGEQVAVGVMADIFNRADEAVTERPGFTPYLEYDRERLVDEETLNDLREKASDR
jgi:hypothetical protein